jgi:hypothetical protein
MAEVAFDHFSALLGSRDQWEYSLDLDFIETRLEDLTALDASFSLEEVWEVVRHLPHSKAPRPDGFTAEFLQSCWDVVKADIMACFDKLYSICGQGFQGLNQALITLLPKKADVAMLKDYRSISLIDIFAKLVAKTVQHV